jgi:hypothetical protein
MVDFKRNDRLGFWKCSVLNLVPGRLRFIEACVAEFWLASIHLDRGGVAQAATAVCIG